MNQLKVLTLLYALSKTIGSPNLLAVWHHLISLEGDLIKLLYLRFLPSAIEDNPFGEPALCTETYHPFRSLLKLTFLLPLD